MSSILGLARVLAVALGAAAALELVRTLTGAASLGGILPDVTLTVFFGASVLSFVLWLALIPALAVFTWRAVRNVLAFEPDFSLTPLGATVGWFLPVWNLYKPYDTLTQIWSATANHPSFEEPAGPGRLLDLFWATWFLAIVIGRVFGGGAEDAMFGWADVVAAGLSAVSGVAGAAVMLRLGAMQEQARQSGVQPTRVVVDSPMFATVG